MNRCKDSVTTFSNDIRMDFRSEKCAQLHNKNGIVDNSPFISDIPSLDLEDSYKYFGIIESSDILHEEIKVKISKEFTWWVRVILESNLIANNTMLAIHAFVLPIMRYWFTLRVNESLQPPKYGWVLKLYLHIILKRVLHPTGFLQGLPVDEQTIQLNHGHHDFSTKSKDAGWTRTTYRAAQW